MLTDRQVKEEFRHRAGKEPEKYYAVNVLKKEGFSRKRCKCGTYFWSIDSKACGKPECSGGFRFIGKSPAGNELDYVSVWEEFSKLFKKLGYTPIKRYPVAARWRADTDFVQASIYDFQPYVVSGEIEPPANPLVVPQACLRFNDIDNIGITGAHYSGFVMIGQHAFMKPKDFNQEKYFSDIHEWLKKGLGLDNREIIFHEDAWAGGGNFGPCMEFFSRGLELGNQVYMLYERTPSGHKELNIKVLDMGMGQERNAWFSQGKSTSYETTFPDVVKKLYSDTGISADAELMKRFLPYASYLNIDEAEDIDKAWKFVAGELKTDVGKLKEKIMPLSALYSVAEHSRTLLFALSDGVLPSNVGGGYNLRILLRRMLSFIDRYGWKTDLNKLCEMHAHYLKKIFPELGENLKEVSEILDVEKRKYMATAEKTRQIVSQIIKTNVDEKKLLQLYDSQGINPEMLREEAAKAGIEMKIPENFYSKVAELHEAKGAEIPEAAELNELKDIPPTNVLYYEDYKKTIFSAKVVAAFGKNIVLDRTYFYATSGGQSHDTGKIAGVQVVNVIRKGSHIIHVLSPEHRFAVGETVECVIDFDRRKQLAQHHTSAHIINGACRAVLGNHVWQAGAEKTEEKARLDITHYEQLSDEQIIKIEELANKIVKKDILVKNFFMERAEAESRYGFRLYQGGVVPGKELRIVEINSFDVEACGGTHLNRTSEAEQIRIIKTSKIQDGVIRIEFAAGKAAEALKKDKSNILEEAAKILGCEPAQVPGRSLELFEKWKAAVKKGKRPAAELVSAEAYKGDALAKTAEILRTQPEHVPKTLRRFLEEVRGRGG